MADVLVKRVEIKDGRITSARVGLHGLPERTVDRDTLIAWLRDGHSLVPVRHGSRLTALQLVEAGEGTLVVRHDNASVAEDSVPAL